MRHMLDAARAIARHMRDRTRQDLEGDELLPLAIVRLLEIAGEAARSVSEETRSHYALIPWNAIAGTRNRLIHGYFNVDMDVVWAIVQNDIPQLIVELEKAVG